jgi:hypothetical protein
VRKRERTVRERKMYVQLDRGINGEGERKKEKES